METAWGVTQRVGKRRESLKRGLVGGGGVTVALHSSIICDSQHPTPPKQLL